MEIFSALLALCAGNSPVPGEFPTQRPVTRSFDVFFDLRLNKWLSKQSWCWWFETPTRSLWRQYNVWTKYVTHITFWLLWRHLWITELFTNGAVAEHTPLCRHLVYRVCTTYAPSRLKVKTMKTLSHGNGICITGPLWWESTGPRYIPPQRTSDAVLWC